MTQIVTVSTALAAMASETFRNQTASSIPAAPRQRSLSRHYSDSGETAAPESMHAPTLAAMLIDIMPDSHKRSAEQVLKEYLEYKEDDDGLPD